MSVLVSVIMSVHNDQEFVGHAIENILSQTFSLYEFIIIDDGSIDSTEVEIRKYSDARIRFIQQKNRGLASSLNYAIQIACGKYIARQDSDDYSGLTRLEKQFCFLETHPEVGLLGCNAILIDETGNKLTNIDYPIENKILQSMLIDYQSGNPFIHGSVMFRRDLVLSLGGYRKSFMQAQDLDLWLRLAEITQVANLSDAYYFWRLRKSAVGTRRWQDQRDYACLARLCAHQRRAGKPEPELKLQSIRNKFLVSALSMLRPVNMDSEYDFRMAQIYFQKGEFLNTRGYLLKVINKKPLHCFAWLLLGLSFLPHRLAFWSYFQAQKFYRRLIWKHI